MKLHSILREKMFLPTLHKIMRRTWRDSWYERYWLNRNKPKEQSIFEEMEVPLFKTPGHKKIDTSEIDDAEISKLNLHKIVAYGTPAKYRLEDLLQCLIKLPVTNSAYHIKGEIDLVHSVNEDLQEEPCETFIFRNGVVVFWNLSNEDIECVMNVLSQYQVFGYAVDNDMQSTDINYYKVSKTRYSSIEADGVFTIPQVNNFYVKYATSCMLATSVSLTIWQKVVELYLSNILERVARDINLGYTISASERDVEQLQGSLSTVIFFMEINDQVYQPLAEDKESNVNQFHMNLCILNSIPRRIKNIEKHLLNCKEMCNLIQVLSSYKTHTKSSIIYYLITIVTCILQTLKYFNGIRDTNAERRKKRLARELARLHKHKK